MSEATLEDEELLELERPYGESVQCARDIFELIDDNVRFCKDYYREDEDGYVYAAYAPFGAMNTADPYNEAAEYGDPPREWRPYF